MWTTLFLAGSMLLGQAAPLSPDELATEVKQQVRELNATELAKREAAERRLIELGPGVLELLPATAPEAEVKLRLDRIRLVLGKAQAEAAAQATAFTFKGEEVAVSEVFAAIEEQTKNRILDYRDQFGQDATDATVTLEFENTPFWEAIDKTLDEAGLTVYPFVGENAIAVVGSGEQTAPRIGGASYAGAFRFEGLEFVARRDLRDAAVQSLQLRLEAAWEPRLSPIALRQDMTEIKVVGDNGESLTVNTEEGEIELAINPGMATVELLVPFDLPSRDIKKIASLKGTMTALLPGGTETFRFANLEKARNVEQKKAGVTVVIEQVRKNNEVWEVRVVIRFGENAGALESHRGWIYNNPAFMEDPNGDPIAYATLETTKQTEEEIGFAYLFSLDGGPKGHTFVYKTPAVIMEQSIDYEVKDLELP